MRVFTMAFFLSHLSVLSTPAGQHGDIETEAERLRGEARRGGGGGGGALGMCPANRVRCIAAGQRGDIEAEAGRLRGEAAAAAVALSGRRRAAAGHLRMAVESCLADLAMAGSRFDVRIGWESLPQVRRRTACNGRCTMQPCRPSIYSIFCCMWTQ